MTTENLSSVHRALDVLRALGSGPLRVQSVADALGKEKTQVSRTLKALAESGFVERDPDSLEYRLGWQLFALAGAASDSRLLQQAAPVLRSLVRAVGEAAYLTVLSGNAAVTVLAERPGRALQAHEWIGRLSPLNCTSSGRALLIGRPDDEVDALLAAQPDPLPGTERAPRTPDDVRARMAVEREAGHSTAVEETEPGLVAVAAPVRDFTGTTIAALNISGPIFRLPPNDLTAAATAVTTAANNLSHALGAP
ncbi:IclR family transcriptional regulator [Saccharopolyspora sp. TS4A08]|uniref:IclR family transcriptional regulator n=1 Tax=Saccharopolyspora ipomoeae TaxID=3042027 RepID=A0ABT6PJZ4_9PSEU|nr:IclR family transcriptional regulator [Saccharopolyspora sp. TS4A08]MDI2028288.1 IclR family transcriptional regulator [Saccharopolyspora sp. TS4A08]